MLHYKIPQNVEVEDSIIGPITMRQLIVIFIGGGSAYMMFMILAQNFFWEVWGPPVGLTCLITVAVAFVEIKGIRFTKFFLLMLEYMLIPKKRVWDKSQSTQFLFHNPEVKKEDPKIKKEEEKESKAEQVSNLEELTKALDMSSILAEGKKTPVEKAGDHDLAAASLQDNDIDRHSARLKNISEDDKISAIRGDSIPLNSTPINTQVKPKVPQEHHDALKKIKT